MKIKEIHIGEYGPYKNWSFSPNQKGLQVLYGSNESGKTSLLQSLRWGLFGKKKRSAETGDVRLVLERCGEEYTLHRHGRKVDFYGKDGKTIEGEPNQLWWRGLDRKTFDRIFAITLEDMQGVDILHEVDVRARFFGAEGGERIGHVVQALEVENGELLVASAQGKKKINLLMEEIKGLDRKINSLSQEEERYSALKTQLDGTTVTEKELVERKEEWREYISSIELVLRAWDTYKRAELARANMAKFSDSQKIDGDAFLKVEEEIGQCQEYMRIWRGREEGLIPDNFDPAAQIGTYSKDIEGLYEELSKWVQLTKEIPQGEEYLSKVREQLTLARRMHSTWRNVDELPSDVNWFEGERLARQLRSAKEGYKQWQNREPKKPDGFDEQMGKRDEKAGLSRKEIGVEKMKEIWGVYSTLESAVKSAEEVKDKSSLFDIKFTFMLAVGLGLIVYVYGLGGEARGLYGIVAALLVFAIIYGYGWTKTYKLSKEIKMGKKDLTVFEDKMKQMAMQYDLPVPIGEYDIRQMERELEEMKSRCYSYDVELAKLYSYEKELNEWRHEGKKWEQGQEEAQKAWQEWLPKEASQVLEDSDFFSLKEEYSRYMERLHEYEGYVKRLEAHKEELRYIEERGAILWEKLGLTVSVTPLELRSLYNRLQHHKQNHIRWEQKESQRKNYHDEYMQWSKKEKELLLERDELVQKAGIKSVSEYRQRLLRQEQYSQWERIYKQSQVQLELLAPKGEHHDLLYRRLQGDDKLKWEAEYSRSQSELNGIEEKLSKLYELRGQLQETMRAMANDKTMTVTLQEKAQVEAELSEALTEWVTGVFMHRFMEDAQKGYERDKRPKTLERASTYISMMTNGKYTLDIGSINEGVFLVSAEGERVPSNTWSSGLGDQVYLALRLSLAITFGESMEVLPIVLDDILVRFDEGRQKAALELLAKLGQEHQIILFTCHEYTYKLSQSIGGIESSELRR